MGTGTSRRVANNPAVLTLALAFGFGSWLLQQSPETTWGMLTTPYNVGSLLMAVTGVLMAAFGVRFNQR